MKPVQYMTDSEFKIYETIYSGYKVIGYYDDGIRLRILLKGGDITPANCVRDMGRYYLIRRYNRIDKIMKVTKDVIKGVEDK